MAKDRAKKKIKVGVKEGGGPPPGYRWNVQILDAAFSEAMGFLGPDQYDHMAMQVRELARQEDATHSDTVDVRPVEGYYEIRDKGGILRRLNVRVFYFVHQPARTIVVMGVIKKENDGATPLGDRVRMRRRMRSYIEQYRPE